jgi:two-component system, NtrC family, sensor histidine kinase KinB
MNIKTKLTLGVGLLFILIILLGVVGVGYINALKADSENILVSNYNSLLHARNMLTALEEGHEHARQHFEPHLVLQEHNISEIGEQEVTDDLRGHYQQYLANPADSTEISAIRKSIFSIIDLNM